MRTAKLIRPLALALGVGLAAACSDTLSVGATGELSVGMQQMSPSLVAIQEMPDSAAPQRSVSPDTVQSLKVTVTAIEVLRADAGDTSDASSDWTRVSLKTPVTIDLMALPGQTDSAFVVDSGTVVAGSYSRLRLFVTNPTIRFKGQVSFGTAGMLQGGVDYAVTIPSGAQTGIKTGVNVTVTATTSGGTTAHVFLLFDQGSTLGNVTVTGNGMVILSPVLHAR